MAVGFVDECGNSTGGVVALLQSLEPQPNRTDLARRSSARFWYLHGKAARQENSSPMLYFECQSLNPTMVWLSMNEQNHSQSFACVPSSSGVSLTVERYVENPS